MLQFCWVKQDEVSNPLKLKGFLFVKYLQMQPKFTLLSLLATALLMLLYFSVHEFA